MTVSNSVESLLSASQNQDTSVKITKELGKEDFLTLLVTQLQNQDPLNPMEGYEFAAQLATFSSLEQLTNIAELLEETKSDDSELSGLLSNTLAATYIGKTIVAEGNSVYLGSEDDAVIRFNLASDANKAVVEIYNSSGVKINEMTVTDIETGENSIKWDGNMSTDERAEEGTYYYNVSALSSDGSSVGVETYLTGIIEGIRMVDGEAFLLVENQEIPLSSVKEILK